MGLSTLGIFICVYLNDYFVFSVFVWFCATIFFSFSDELKVFFIRQNTNTFSASSFVFVKKTKKLIPFSSRVVQFASVCCQNTQTKFDQFFGCRMCTAKTYDDNNKRLKRFRIEKLSNEEKKLIILLLLFISEAIRLTSSSYIRQLLFVYLAVNTKIYVERCTILHTFSTFASPMLLVFGWSHSEKNWFAHPKLISLTKTIYEEK